jgi:hypothetical protein
MRSRHTSLQLMKLCGVIVLSSRIEYASERVGRPAETISCRVVYSASEVTAGRQASIFVRRDGRSDRGEMEGIAERSLMTAQEEASRGMRSTPPCALKTNSKSCSLAKPL